jgi:hypothetical protein
MGGKDFITKIENSKRVALCTNKVENFDIAYFAVALAEFAKKSDTEIDLIYVDDIKEDYKQLFDKYNVNYSKDPKPLSYVISIDYSKVGIDKVTYDTDEKSGELKFFIVPTEGIFDFDNVEYATEGSDYDLTITFGINSFKDMGSIYEKSSYLFKDNEVVSFAKDIDSLGDQFVKVNSDPYIWALFELINGSVNKSIMRIFAEGMLRQEGILEGGATSRLWRVLTLADENGVDINQLIRSKYYSYSKSGLKFNRHLMNNLKSNKEHKIIWSKVPYEKLSELSLTGDTFEHKGRLIFNVTEDFDLALGVFEVEKDCLLVIIESNKSEKYSAKKIANVFGGRGTRIHAEFTMEDLPIDSFEERVLKVISDLYDIDIKVNSSENGS